MAAGDRLDGLISVSPNLEAWRPAFRAPCCRLGVGRIPIQQTPIPSDTVAHGLEGHLDNVAPCALGRQIFRLHGHESETRSKGIAELRDVVHHCRTNSRRTEKRDIRARAGSLAIAEQALR